MTMTHTQTQLACRGCALFSAPLFSHGSPVHLAARMHTSEHAACDSCVSTDAPETDAASTTTTLSDDDCHGKPGIDHTILLRLAGPAMVTFLMQAIYPATSPWARPSWLLQPRMRYCRRTATTLDKRVLGVYLQRGMLVSIVQ